MADNKNIFPDYFPENCPPEEATTEEIKVFRLCENNPATEDDFLPYVIKFPNRDFSGDVKAYGVSVISDANDIEKMKGAVPNLRKRFKYVATGITLANTGVILRTPSNNCLSHLTWWLYKDIYPHTFFEMYEQVV